MGEKITEAQAADLLALLRTDASIDSKVAQVTNVKSGIKQNNVPDSCVAPLFEIIRISMTSQHAALVSAGFTTLSHLLARLSRQEPKHIAKEAARTLPLVVEKIGDHKEKYRTLAAQCLTTFWKASPMDVERVLRNSAMTGKNSRAKEVSMQWLAQMHQENGLQFRSFVPTLMELLEDADGMVRDVARNTVIDLFQNAPNTAKSDLKKQLKTFNVRPTIVAAITAQIGPGGPVETESVVSEPRAHFAESVSSQTSMRPETPVVEPKPEHVEPAYVNTQRELDDTFRDMHQYFEGKESEQNWLKREQSCTKIRKLNAGNAPSDFHDAWLVGIKVMLDGILKAVNSLRTSLSKEGCSVVQEVVRTAGPGLDPMVEILLQNLIKLCGGTKKIASQAGDTTVDIIISKVSYNIRILQHIWLACQDKNVQPRTYAAGWLTTLLKKESHHKNHVEHTGGLDLIEKCIKKELADANPGVREKMRGTYWVFAQIWPAKAESLLGTLDATQQRLLEMDPGNPNSLKKVDSVAAVRPGMGFSKSTTGPPKPSLRETMLAQKKAAMATKNLPARPGSAMSSFSPVRAISTASTSSTASNSSEAAPLRSRPDTSSTVSHGGLSVAPMRPTKSRPRPELTRPATAGPYSVRRAAPASANSTDPTSTATTPSRLKAITSSLAAPVNSQKRTLPRPNTSHSSHASVASINSVSSHNSTHNSPSKEKSSLSRIPISPRSSPRSSKSFTNGVQLSSPSKADEDLTMVMPSLDIPHQTHRSFDLNEPNESQIVTPGKSLKVYEDPFSSTDDQTTPRPTYTAPVLGEVPVNEDAANMALGDGMPKAELLSPEKSKQNSRLLDSGITSVKAKSLDVHGFRKLQALIRENKASWTDDRFGALLLGLFDYLESPLASLTPEKVQDVKAQILATIKLMLKNDRDAFEPHVPMGLQSLLQTRSSYDARAHIVSGLELLADELVGLADPEETTHVLVAQLQAEEMSQEGCRTLSMGLHILKELLNGTMSYMPSDEQMNNMGKLALRCLDSGDSGVRKDAVELCVAIHAMVGERYFWSVMDGVKDDPKSLITYYIVKRQRESGAV